MGNSPDQFGGLVIELNMEHFRAMVKARRARGNNRADEKYLQVQALVYEGKVIAAFPYLEAGNWYCQPPWLQPNGWYLITVFPGTVTRFIP